MRGYAAAVLGLPVLVAILVWGRAGANEYPPKVNRKAILVWVQVLESGDQRRQEAALGCLSPAGVAARAAVPTLIKGLETKDLNFAFHCLEILARIGPGAREAGP